MDEDMDEVGPEGCDDAQQAVELSIVILVDGEEKCSTRTGSANAPCRKQSRKSLKGASSCHNGMDSCRHCGDMRSPSSMSLPCCKNQKYVIGPICVDKREQQQQRRCKSASREEEYDNNNVCGNCGYQHNYNQQPTIIPTEQSNCPCASIRSGGQVPSPCQTQASQTCIQPETPCQAQSCQTDTSSQPQSMQTDAPSPCSQQQQSSPPQPQPTQEPIQEPTPAKTCAKTCTKSAGTCKKSVGSCPSSTGVKPSQSKTKTPCNKAASQASTVGCQTVNPAAQPGGPRQGGSGPCGPRPCGTAPSPCGATRPKPKPCQAKAAKSAICQTQPQPQPCRPRSRPKTCQPPSTKPCQRKKEAQTEDECPPCPPCPPCKGDGSEDRSEKRERRSSGDHKERRRSQDKERRGSREEKKERRKSLEKERRGSHEEKRKRRRSSETKDVPETRQARRSMTKPEELNFAQFPKVQLTFVDYFLKAEGGITSVIALAEVKQDFEKNCKALLAKVPEQGRTQAKEFFMKILEAVQVKVPDSNNTEIKHYHLMKYLNPVVAALEIQAQQETHAIHKYHNYILAVVQIMEDRLRNKETINPDALVDIDTQLLAGIMSRFYPLFIKIKEKLVTLSAQRGSQEQYPPENYVKQLKKLILAMYVEIVCIDVTFNNTLTSLSYLPNVEVQDKYRSQLEIRKKHARHAVTWGARCISSVILFYFIGT